MGPVRKPVKKQTSFLALPYEIRHLIYGAVYPTGVNIIVYEKDIEQINDYNVPHKKSWSYPLLESNLPLACQAINKEIIKMFYGNNAFTVMTLVSKYRAFHSRSELFLKQLRPATASSVAKLVLWLGPDLEESFIEALVPSVGNFAHVEIAITRFVLMPDSVERKIRPLVRRACCLIAEARVGAETVWNARGDAGNIEMLRSIMPNGYQRKE